MLLLCSKTVTSRKLYVSFSVLSLRATDFCNRTCMKHDVLYTMEANKFVKSLLLRYHDVKTCILADA